MNRLMLLATLVAGAIAQATETITITIVASSDGGGSQTQQMAAPMMSPGMTHQVTVGGEAGLVYTPSYITAAVGDFVQFNFMSQNHTVTQSAFTTPCEKLSNGTDSGFMPNPNNTVSPPPMMMFQVMTSSPIWMYCRQTGHCGKGMVFAINPTATKSFAAFQSMAIAQNGTGTASSSAAPPPASSAPPAATAAAPPAAVSSASSSVVQGTGTMNGDTCSCSCLCGTDAFPAGAGVGMMGGYSGAIDVSAMVNVGKKRSTPLLS